MEERQKTLEARVDGIQQKIIDNESIDKLEATEKKLEILLSKNLGLGEEKAAGEEEMKVTSPLISAQKLKDKVQPSKSLVNPRTPISIQLYQHESIGGKNPTIF